jgi:hypothetical protein
MVWTVNDSNKQHSTVVPFSLLAGAVVLDPFVPMICPENAQVEHIDPFPFLKYDVLHSATLDLLLLHAFALSALE